MFLMASNYIWHSLCNCLIKIGLWRWRLLWICLGKVLPLCPFFFFFLSFSFWCDQVNAKGGLQRWFEASEGVVWGGQDLLANVDQLEAVMVSQLEVDSTTNYSRPGLAYWCQLAWGYYDSQPGSGSTSRSGCRYSLAGVDWLKATVIWLARGQPWFSQREVGQPGIHCLLMWVQPV